MKTGKTVLFAAAALFVFSCVSKVEEPAEDLLARARTEFENGRYNNARILLDSIKIVSPKAYKTLREAEKLRREAMKKECERNVVFYETELQSLIAARDSLAALFDFNFDKRYQNKGYYTVSSQAMSQNVYNNFLVFLGSSSFNHCTNRLGNSTLSSNYFTCISFCNFYFKYCRLFSIYLINAYRSFVTY